MSIRSKQFANEFQIANTAADDQEEFKVENQDESMQTHKGIFIIDNELKSLGEPTVAKNSPEFERQALL